MIKLLKKYNYKLIVYRELLFMLCKCILNTIVKAATNRMVLQVDMLRLEKDCVLCDVIANLFLSRVNIVHCSHV